MTLYKIVRYYAPGVGKKDHTVSGKTGLCLAEVQAHCNDPSTRKEGVYFDGYVRE